MNAKRLLSGILVVYSYESVLKALSTNVLYYAA